MEPDRQVLDGHVCLTMEAEQARRTLRTTAVDPAVSELWLNFVRTRDAELREAIVSRYGDLVRILAARAYSGRISAELEFDDYLQFGRIGLLEAIDRFDPGRGVKFETFSSPRITGAILNGVESLSEKQKQVSVRQQVLKERAASQLDGVAVRSHDAFERLAGVAIGLAIGFLLEDSGMYVEQEAAMPDDCYRQTELRQLQRRVRETVELLSPQEQKVVVGHYLQHQPFDALAKEMQLSKGRISQIHHAALSRMREKLTAENFQVNL